MVSINRWRGLQTQADAMQDLSIPYLGTSPRPADLIDSTDDVADPSWWRKT